MGGKKFLEVVFKNSTQSPILGREQLFMSLQMTSIFGSTNFVTILVGWINLVGKNLHPVLHNTTRGTLTVVEQIKKSKENVLKLRHFKVDRAIYYATWLVN